MIGYKKMKKGIINIFLRVDSVCIKFSTNQQNSETTVQINNRTIRMGIFLFCHMDRRKV